MIAVTQKETIKEEKGERIGSRPSYGYVKDPNNRNHIIVDEETTPVVHHVRCGTRSDDDRKPAKRNADTDAHDDEYRKSGTAVTELDIDRPYGWNRTQRRLRISFRERIISATP